jgi:hypothetical protein
MAVDLAVAERAAAEEVCLTELGFSVEKKS